MGGFSQTNDKEEIFGLIRKLLGFAQDKEGDELFGLVRKLLGFAEEQDNEEIFGLLKNLFGFSQTMSKEEIIGMLRKLFGFSEEGEDFVCGGLCVGLASAAAPWALSKLFGAEVAETEKEKIFGLLKNLFGFVQDGEEDQ